MKGKESFITHKEIHLGTWGARSDKHVAMRADHVAWAALALVVEHDGFDNQVRWLEAVAHMAQMGPLFLRPRCSTPRGTNCQKMAQQIPLLPRSMEILPLNLGIAVGVDTAIEQHAATCANSMVCSQCM